MYFMLAALQTLAQYTTTTTTTYSVNNNTSTGIAAFFSGTMLIIWLVVAVIVVIGMWKVFEKAKKPGWAAIIPIYNMIVLLQIAGRPIWWILLFLLGGIPFVGWIIALIVAAIVYNDVSKSFGQGVGTTILLLLLPIVGWPWLGFGDAKYKGPAGPEKATKA